LADCPAANGASGSVFASWTRFVTGADGVLACLSTVFFAPGAALPSAGLSALRAGDWAAARPGLSTDLVMAGFAAAAGLSVDFGTVGRGIASTVLAGTSRVSVFKLA
jgi:hypothetical protein